MPMYCWNRMLIAGLIALLASAAGADEEQDLIATLQSAAGVPQKCAACQKLRIIGTTRAVPALAALLGDEGTSHAARYALEAMPCNEAGTALRQAARTTSGLVQAGLIDSLGWRGDREAVPQLAPLLAGADETVAAAAATALGRIGGRAADAALSAARDKSPPSVLPSILEGLLRCGERLRAEGDESAAAALYRPLLADRFPAHFRVAAWRGLVQTDAAGRCELVTSALTGADGVLRAAAAQGIRESSDPQVIEAYVARWAALPAEAQLAVMDAHRRRGAEALPTVRAAAASPHPAVRVAAWHALAELNIPATIPMLAQAAAHGEPAERDAARDALTQMHGPGVREALFSEVESLEPPAKTELLRVLGERGESEAASVLLRHAAAEAELVRAAALEALRKLAVEAALGPLLELVVKPLPGADGEPLRRALFAVCQACRDKNQATVLVLDAMRGAAVTERRQLLTVMNALGTDQALSAVQNAARGEDPDLAKDAVRVLADWPSAAAAPGLLELAARSDDATLHALAMRGFVRLTAHEPNSAQRIALLRQALTAARRTEEKRQALGQLGQLTTPDALEAVLPYLAEDGLRQEAATAAVSVAERLAGSHPELVAEAAARLLALDQSADIVRRATALRGKPKSGSFLRQWLVCGPYRQSGISGAEKLFSIAFGPEKADENVPWRAVPPADMVDLSGIFPGQTDCVAYLKTWVIVPQDSAALLLVGSDDGIQAWLNGAVVHANNTDRPATIDEDTAPIKLNKGPNLLMLKVTQGAGGWSACARIVRPDGETLPGLRCDLQGEAGR